jgi:ribonuclease H2 subunit A
MNNLHSHCNLNEISHQSALLLCREALREGFRVAHIIADTVGDPKYYARYLRENLMEYVDVVKDITVQPKADRDHKVVSASSICAKVTRDKILKNWLFR